MEGSSGRHYFHKIQSEYHYKQHLFHYEQYLHHQRLSITKPTPEPEVSSEQFEAIEEHRNLRHQRHREAMVNIGRTRTTAKVETEVKSSSTPTPTASILTSPSTTYITTSATTAPDPGPNCHDFICLLGNFDLLKTDSGYLLTNDGKKNEESSAAAKCQDFLCWLSQFEIKSKSFGFQLVRKDTKSVSNTDLSEMSDIFRLGKVTPSNSVSLSTQSPQLPSSIGNWDKTSDENSVEDPEDFWSSFKFNQSEEDEEKELIASKPAHESGKEKPQKSLTKLDYDSLFRDYNF